MRHCEYVVMYHKVDTLGRERYYSKSFEAKEKAQDFAIQKESEDNVYVTGCFYVESEEQTPYYDEKLKAWTGFGSSSTWEKIEY